MYFPYYFYADEMRAPYRVPRERELNHDQLEYALRQIRQERRETARPSVVRRIRLALSPA